MNKLLAFLGGVAVAYFVMQELEKRKAASKPSTPPVDPKKAACEAQLAEKLKVMRISGDALETYKKQFMVECLGGNQDFGGEGSVTNPSAVDGMPCPLGTTVGVYKNGICVRPTRTPTDITSIEGLFNDFPLNNTAV